MYAYVVKLQIDEERKYCLTKFTNKSGSTTCTKESDHNTLILEIDKRWNTSENDVEKRTEILNFKNEENFKTFVEITNNSDELKKCFTDPNEDLEKASKSWLKCIKLILKGSFDKIRIRKGNLKPQLQLLFQERETLKSKIAQLENESKYQDIHTLQNKLENVNNKLGCASVKLLVWLEFTKALSDFITKKKISFKLDKESTSQFLV